MAKRFLFKKDKKGLSTIVITVILIAVSIAAIGLVWSFASNMINKQMRNTEACFGNFDKITLNKQYTCYVESGTTTKTYTLRFSLSRGDVAVEKIIVGASSPSSIKSFTITDIAGTVTGLNYYPSGSSIKIPDRNAGLSYVTTTTFSEKPDSLRIAPVINGVQCDVSDSVNQIADCALMDI